MTRTLAVLGVAVYATGVGADHGWLAWVGVALFSWAVWRRWNAPWRLGG